MTACFTTDRMLKFGDCDISGTAYFPAYLNILNGVVEQFWAHIGYPWLEIIWKERRGTPTVHLSCDFSKPSFLGDTLTFRLTVLGQAGKFDGAGGLAAPARASRRPTSGLIKGLPFTERDAAMPRYERLMTSKAAVEKRWPRACRSPSGGP